VGEVPLDWVVAYQYVVGCVYLIIGLFVYFRRGSAHKAQHFYILCLASFIFFCSHYTGRLDAFDKTIYYANIAAGMAAAAAFLHFCVTFPERLPWFHSRIRTAALYFPGALLFLAYLAVSSGAVRTGVPLLEVRWLLDRIWMALVAGPTSSAPWR